MAKIRSILTQGLKNFGKAGDVVFIKRGYLRYLQTIDRAVPATKLRLEALEKNQEHLLEKDAQQRLEAQEMALRFAEYKIVMHKHASIKGSLYGKLGKREIAQALQEQGVVVSPEHIALHAPIKNVGMYKVDLAYHPEIPVSIQVEVIGQEEKNH